MDDQNEVKGDLSDVVSREIYILREILGHLRREMELSSLGQTSIEQLLKERGSLLNRLSDIQKQRKQLIPEAAQDDDLLYDQLLSIQQEVEKALLKHPSNLLLQGSSHGEPSLKLAKPKRLPKLLEVELDIRDQREVV